MIEQKNYGEQLLKELTEYAKQDAESSDQGFSGGKRHIIKEFWELKEVLKHLQSMNDEYHFRINIESNYDDEAMNFRVDHITAQGRWGIIETWGRELKIQPNGTIGSININTHVYDFWTILVDSMGWIDVSLSDGDMNIKDGVDFIHLVFLPKK